MKKNYIILCSLLILILFILTHQQISIDAASSGLLLWYERILPTLLPLAILSNLMVYSNYMQLLTKYLYPVTKHILNVSPAGSFAFWGGILFGFPMGSKISADLMEHGRITKQEGEVLAICCNQLSPLFISGYVLTSVLHMPQLVPVTYAILYLPPLCYAKWKLKQLQPPKIKNSASDSFMNFRIIDAGIMNGFEALTKLGGYIILFSICSAMVQTITANPHLNLLLTGITEVTTGTSLIGSTSLPVDASYALAIFFCSFGGLCGFAQTCSMTKECHISNMRYLLCRFTFAICSGSVAYLLYGLIY